MNVNEKTSVGEIVKANFKTAQLFDKNNIDFCCGGGISLKEACERSKVDVSQLLPELEALIAQKDPDSAYIDGLELDVLCDYIEKRHHAYVTENIPFIQQKLQKLCDVHGERHPELFEIRELFDATAVNLSAHMKKEELILFPYIRKMVKYKKEGISGVVVFDKGKSAIEVMQAEHESEGERFEKIAKLTSSYTCPADGCSTYRVSYQTLKDFENDLHRHIHLENNILFKKALNLERELINE
ncbi:iron-sulfur cluster repair di-iron protein [Saccharicrinis fermentans]|uniref:Cell wall-related protein ScdA n=1 Tax=Saccharicrinis fermentans DSM 9555 = JCM 21142 TaxID=869213 RepID=W7YLI2_9BACT|nr:iron-sulfur cluster repair di-iron protein [Saccharicrinis fermentans]GAF05436.1 cell wall-related protein ScdA [Saccharicrinis fermentans DSM 9555 = JCM 21142]